MRLKMDTGMAGATIRREPEPAKHTPTPWRSRDNVIVGAEGGLHIAKTCGVTAGEQKANAELVVRAVNCHEELVEALTALVKSHTQLVDSGDCGCWESEEEPEVIAARAAIAKATGGAQP